MVKKKMLVYLGIVSGLLLAMFPSLRPNAPAHLFTAPRNGVIVIDAGHGGIDGGASTDQLIEKDINLAVALKLRDALIKKGFRVVMTREEDVSLDSLNNSSQSRHRRDLIARMSIVNGSHAELFVSIHADSNARHPAADGSIVLYGDTFPHNQSLALCIQRALNGITVNGKKRTVHDPREGDYYLLNHAQIPGVIVETAFLTNAAEHELLKQDAFRDKLARAVALGIEQYFSQMSFMGKSDW